jgi:hypothetical protein
MKRLILQILLLSTAFLFSLTSQIIPVNAASNSSSDPSANPAVLCLPGIYINDPGDCTPAGPSTYLTQMAKIGITFPLTPLPASQADLSLAQMDIHYGEVKTENAPIYPSVEVALEKKKKFASERINASFAYISYDRSEGRGWMTAADVSRIGVLPRFQGLTFNRTPNNSFGWILSFLNATPVETKLTPGYQIADLTGHLLTEYEVVQIYDVATVDDSDWYMVGPDEWLPEKVVARVTPDTIPPEGVTGDRWIAINLDQQTIAVYDQRQLVFATVIASGSEPFWTQPGLFPIYEKLEKTPMRGAFEADGGGGYYLEDVPWTMYFDQARALHGAYWRTKMGFSQSHGCVNMTVGDAHWIFNWANIGDPVYVWDPSGQTPTDPSLYSSGGY